jgi:hypothetical protein
VHAHLDSEFTLTVIVAGAYNSGDVTLLHQVKPKFTLTSTAARHHKICDIAQLVTKVGFDHNRKAGDTSRVSQRQLMSLSLFTSRNSQFTSCASPQGDNSFPLQRQLTRPAHTKSSHLVFHISHITFTFTFTFTFTALHNHEEEAAIHTIMRRRQREESKAKAEAEQAVYCKYRRQSSFIVSGSTRCSSSRKA